MGAIVGVGSGSARSRSSSTIATTLYTMIIGDFSFYWIADALDFELQVLVERYADTNQNGYIARQEVDGMPVLEEAFVRLKQP